MIMVEEGYRGMDTAYKSVTLPPEIATWWPSNRLMIMVEEGYRGMDTAYKSVTLPPEIATWC